MPNTTSQHTPPHAWGGGVEAPGGAKAEAAATSPPGTWLVTVANAAHDRDVRGGRLTARRVGRAAVRFAATVALGIAVFLAWPLGDAARVTIANMAPQLWVGRADPGVAAAVAVGATVPVVAVSGPQPPAAVPPDLAAMRERIAGLAAGAEQMTRAVADLAAGQARLAQELARVRDLEAQTVRTRSPAGAARVPLPERRPGRRHAAR